MGSEFVNRPIDLICRKSVLLNYQRPHDFYHCLPTFNTYQQSGILDCSFRSILMISNRTDISHRQTFVFFFVMSNKKESTDSCRDGYIFSWPYSSVFWLVVTHKASHALFTSLIRCTFINSLPNSLRCCMNDLGRQYL